jgi:hypothetical protein
MCVCVCVCVCVNKTTQDLLKSLAISRIKAELKPTFLRTPQYLKLWLLVQH